jgi:hypothetical protein
VPEYLYRCPANHQRLVEHRMLYSTGVACRCGLAMWRVPQAARVNWNGSRAGREPAPQVQQLIRTADARRDAYRANKEAYERDKRAIGRD